MADLPDLATSSLRIDVKEQDFIMEDKINTGTK